MAPAVIALDDAPLMCETAPIRTRANPTCVVCGDSGLELYGPIPDRLFGSPGEWQLKRCRQSRCGVIWLDPIPVEEDLWRAYDNYYTHDQSDGPVRDSPEGFYHHLKWRYMTARFGARGQRNRFTATLALLAMGIYPPALSHALFPLQYLPRRQTGRILEVGFGDGKIMDLLSSAGWDAFGVETDPVSVRAAEGRGLKVSKGPLNDKLYEHEQFDAVFSSHVIEHVYDPLELMINAFKVLRPGGLFIAVTPNSGSLGHRWFRSCWLHLDPPRHLQIFNPECVATLAKRAGFRAVRVVPSCRGTAALWSLSKRFARGTKAPSESPKLELHVDGLFAELLEWLLAPFIHSITEELVLIGHK